jgi:hypothetical protein
VTAFARDVSWSPEWSPKENDGHCGRRKLLNFPSRLEETQIERFIAGTMTLNMALLKHLTRPKAAGSIGNRGGSHGIETMWRRCFDAAMDTGSFARP